MAKEVAKVEKKEVAVAAPPPVPVAAPHIGADDLLIPKILPIHYMSEKAIGKNAVAKPGEFRDSVENKLFGDLDTPFQFIPLHMISYFAEYEIQGEGDKAKRVYVGSVPITNANEKAPREEIRGGKKINRMKTYEVYVLLPEEVKKGTAFPYVLAFRSTSLRAGKTLLTQMYIRNQAAKIAQYGVVCEVSISEDINDKGDFCVMGVKPMRAASTEEQAAAKHWLDMITAGEVRKDDSDLETAGHSDGVANMSATNSEAF